MKSTSSSDCPALSQFVHYGYFITYIALHRGKRSSRAPLRSRNALGPTQARCFPGPHIRPRGWAARLLYPNCPSAGLSHTPHLLPSGYLETAINQRILQRRQPHHQATLFKVLQLAKPKKNLQTNKTKQKKKGLVGDIQTLFSDGKEHQRDQNMFLPASCRLFVLLQVSGTQARLLKPQHNTPHTWFWWQFRQGLRVTKFRFSNRDQPTHKAFAPLLSYRLTKQHLDQKIPRVFFTHVQSGALPQLVT